jgi:hypothetical protein
VGTEAARLQDRLEAALGPAWGIERELRGGGMSRVFLNDARLRGCIVSKVLHPDLAADLSMDHRADLYTLGMMADELLVGSSSAAAVVMRLPAHMLQIGRETPRRSFVHSIRSRRRASPWRPAAIVMSTLVYGVSLSAPPQPCPVASILPSTHVRRTLAPRNSGRSTRKVVFPPPTGGRYK